MEYLPWILIAFGLFLLFVTSQRRKTRSSCVTGSRNVSIGEDIRVSHSEAPDINRRVLQDAQRLPSPPEEHVSVVWMPVVLSLLVTGAALAVVLLPGYYGEAQQKWAFGVIGLILGYWFKK